MMDSLTREVASRELSVLKTRANGQQQEEHATPLRTQVDAAVIDALRNIGNQVVVRQHDTLGETCSTGELVS